MSDKISVKPKSSTKKSRHNVPSRYKESAEKFSSTRRDRTLCYISKDSQGSSKNNKLVTSTPANKNVLPMAALDASVIPGPANLSGQKLEQNSSNQLEDNQEVLCTNKPKFEELKIEEPEDFNQEEAEDMMDLLYAQYLQAAFIESKARRALELRSKDVLEKLSKMMHIIKSLTEKKVFWENQVICLSHMIKGKEHAEKQEQILKPILEIIPSLESQYEDIAKAVDKKRHKLHIKDVIKLKPEQEDDINQMLQNMNDVLDILMNKIPNLAEIFSLAETHNLFADDIKLIAETLKRGFELLFESRNLLLSEASLKLGLKSF
ncbi:uncharacterized protein LOC118205509 [Stegodyphus dumicola]|uniref:uncharacterized protein LOC118205509 n=1 Tax=Stegodyphus dumicola TaxID=202533 RepID=UPI0015B23541|nr:uncharacterized protein LOC118205509 [Stegodyphus dumicola]